MGILSWLYALAGRDDEFPATVVVAKGDGTYVAGVWSADQPTEAGPSGTGSGATKADAVKAAIANHDQHHLPTNKY